MDKKEFFRKELKIDKALWFDKMVYDRHETKLMNAIDKYIDSGLKVEVCEICGSNNEHVYKNPNCDCYEKAE